VIASSEGGQVDLHRFLVVIEKVGKNYAAHLPDLPGCIATGETREEVERNIHEAIQMHLQGLREDNLPIPKGESSAEYIAVL
jgi:predicted RNase H-like HicB family nuclease